MDADYIIHRLREGLPLTKIANELSCSRNTLYRHMEKQGVSPRDFKLNHDTFECIDDEHTAYWLGFLYADGNVMDKKGVHRISFNLHERDESHLHKFRDFIDCIVKPRPFREFIRLSVHSQKMVNDLISHGCVPRKSLILSPPGIEDHLIPHFMRGYWDGDGSFSVRSYQTKDSLYSSIVGTEVFLNWIQDVLIEASVIANRKKLQPDGKIKTLKINGGFESLNLVKYLYTGASVYLDRKYSKIKPFLEQEHAPNL